MSAQTPWAKRIEKGQSVPIGIRFANGEVDATLRRINNAVGHLQIGYESAKQISLREYLASEFSLGSAETCGPLEVVQSPDGTFCFRPLPGNRKSPPTLTVVKPLFQNMAEHDAKALPEYENLVETLATITYRPDDGQREYNARIAHALCERGWRKEASLLSDLGLRVDFESNGVWVEVEFGNARTYYQDYIKFALAHRYKSAVCGILICPTDPFAHLLCELGRKRTARRRSAGTTKQLSYSGMMTYEKAARELPFLQFLLPGKLVVAGISLSRTGATV